MEEKKPTPQNPFAVYTVVSHISFIVVTPLLLFLWGGSALVRHFDWPGWVNVVFIFTGVLTMLMSLAGYLIKLVRLYGEDKPDPYRKLKNTHRDHDYYDKYDNDQYRKGGRL